MSGARSSAAKGRFECRTTPAFCRSRHFWRAASSCAGVKGVLNGGREYELELGVVVSDGVICFLGIMSSKLLVACDLCEELGDPKVCSRPRPW